VNSRQAENLFRKNAIDSLTTKQHGRPIAVMPRPWAWLTFLCIAFCAASCIFCWKAEYARKETVRGWLVSEQGVVRVTHGTSAIVESVMRKAGDEVRQGDAIAHFSTEETLGNGEASASGILAELHDQLAQTDSRESSLRDGIAAQHAALDRQVRGIANEIADIRAQMREQHARVSRAAENLERVQRIRNSGALAAVEFLRQEDDVAAMRLSLGRLRQEHNRLNREREELLAAQAGLDLEMENSLASLTTARAELRQRITVQEQRRLVILQAPIDGTLATLDVIAGTRVRSQQLIATIVPEKSSLAADVYVPSRAIGLIREGQVVRLHYDAFPHEQFGVASGNVESIAGFVSLPADVPQTFGVREAAYKVRIAVDADYVTDRTGRYALRPGMSLGAEIVLEKRSLAQWLLAPFRGRF
jgi:membrane fusion protein